MISHRFSRQFPHARLAGTWELGSEEGQPGNFKGLSSLKSPDVKSPQLLLEKEPREGGKEGEKIN